MRLNRWLYAAASFGMMAGGALAEESCSNTLNYCESNVGDAGPQTFCYLYSPLVPDSSVTAPVDAGAKKDTGTSEAGACGQGTPPFGPGDGGPCSGPVGGFPAPSCDPSDESAQSCQGPMDPSCSIAKVCGDPTTCEPFVTNPVPGKGVDNFRMRLINITAPPALATTVVQVAVVSAGVDLPASPDAGGAACGENGTGLFNWLLSVDKANNQVITGGAPFSPDPFTTGYCYVNGTVAGTPVAPSTLKATFNCNTFSTEPLTNVLQIPIFVAGGGAVILPINGASLNDVTVSDDGNCIGAVNNFASSPSSSGACVDPLAFGAGSCSRWHSAGSLGGYITLAQADNVPIVTLGGESLCVLLTGDNNGGTPPKCTTAGLSDGNYCAPKGSTPGKACTGGDSFWLSAQFAASAVNIQPKGMGPAICNGGSIGGMDAGK